MALLGERDRGYGADVALDGTVVIDPSGHDPVVSELVRPAGSLPLTAWGDNDYEATVTGLLDHLAVGARRIGWLRHF